MSICNLYGFLCHIAKLYTSPLTDAQVACVVLQRPLLHIRTITGQASKGGLQSAAALFSGSGQQQ